MSRHPFGYDYPAGAEHDPHAPWNQTDSPECRMCSTPGNVDSADETYTTWRCPDCGYTWWEQTGPDPDDARDAARDDALTGDR